MRASLEDIQSNVSFSLLLSVSPIDVIDRPMEHDSLCILIFDICSLKVTYLGVVLSIARIINV